MTMIRKFTKGDLDKGVALVSFMLDGDMINVAPIVAAALIALKMGGRGREEVLSALAEAWDSINMLEVMEGGKGGAGKKN